MTDLRMSGVFTALVTPFTEDGTAVDWPAYEAFVQSQLDDGVAGLVPCGTTGEAPTLSETERFELVKRTAAVVRGRAPILVGTGSNSTQKTIETSRAAIEAGADGVMVVMPYYSKPSQQGLVHHVTLVARAVGAPVVLYNVPSRTASDLAVESLLEILDENPNVIGLKDASGNVLYCQELLRRAGDRIAVMCGDDPLTLPLMSVGAKGVISVTSNVYPKQTREVVEDALAGRWEEARRKHFRLLPVHRVLFIEASPQPTKAALAQKGRINISTRPPLVAPSEECRAKVLEAMNEFEGP